MTATLIDFDTTDEELALMAVEERNEALRVFYAEVDAALDTHEGTVYAEIARRGREDRLISAAEDKMDAGHYDDFGFYWH